MFRSRLKRLTGQNTALAFINQCKQENDITVESDKPTNRFAPGTHVRAGFGLYQHHGIVVEGDEVIHFGRGAFDVENAIVEKVDLETFSQGNPIHVVDDLVVFEPDEVVARAESRLGEQGYDLFDNNCEHFATWCRSGDSHSRQVSTGETVARQTAAVASKPLLGRLAKRTMVRRLGPTAVVAKVPLLVAGVADVVQTTAELAAANRGRSRTEAKVVGRSAGIASSTAIGWVVGGPGVAMAGLGFWFVGQLLAESTVEQGKQAIKNGIKSASQTKARHRV